MSNNKDKDGYQLPLFEFDKENEAKRANYPVSERGKESGFSKYVVYVDESGDHSLESIDENYPVFVLAFCVFHKRHYSEVIVPALEKFKFNHFGHDQVILHEHEIRKRKGAFNIFKTRQDQLQFINELTEIIEFSNFVLISATIDKNELGQQSSGENAYHIALRMCMEALYEFMEEKQQHNEKTHVVVESRGKKEDRELELEFRRVCDGENRRSLILPFDILFADKKAMSSGLQMADLVARPVGLATIRPEQSNRAFEVLKEKFYCEGGRSGTGEGYEGKGMKIYPNPKSEKPR